MFNCRNSAMVFIPRTGAGWGEVKERLAQKNLALPLEDKHSKTRSNLIGSQGFRSGAGIGGLSDALLVPMLLNGGCGYAQL
jgi:hypothetical protein